jgi:hypothetical protein
MMSRDCIAAIDKFGTIGVLVRCLMRKGNRTDAAKANWPGLK